MRALRSSIQRSAVSHAYLFAGPGNTGKTTAALAFAAALNCANPSEAGDACGLCASCVRIQSGDNPDVRLVSPEGDQTKIEQMQEMIKALNFAPLDGKYHVFIIEQADTLNPSSENCILKILEEPPLYAVLILISSNPNSLLPTIRSRCRMVKFKRAGAGEVEEAVRKNFDLLVLRSEASPLRRVVPEDELRVIVACSGGAIGRAFQLASDPEAMEERRAVIEILKGWADGPAVASIQAAETIRLLAEPRKDDPDERTRIARLTDMLDHILSWYADLIVLKVTGSEAYIGNIDCAEHLRDHAERYSLGRLRKAAGIITETRRYLEGNITPQLALENMLFDLRPDIQPAA